MFPQFILTSIRCLTFLLLMNPVASASEKEAVEKVEVNETEVGSSVEVDENIQSVKTPIVQNDKKKEEEEVPTRPSSSRKKIYSFSFSRSDTKFESVKTIRTVGDVEIGFNHGFFQPTLGYSFVNTDKKNGSQKSNEFDGYITVAMKFNIVENKPGNDLIPFFGAGISQYIGNASDNSPAWAELRGQPVFLELGLLWFPAQEYIGFQLSLHQSSGELDFEAEDENGIYEEDIDFNISDVQFSIVLAFD